VIRVGVIGAGGRLGTPVCEAVAAEPGLELVAAIGRSAAGRTIGGVEVSFELAVLADAACDVVVELTDADGARAHVPWLAEHGIHAVVGSSGITDGDVEAWRGAFTSSNCLVASNFAISAMLLMRFAELAAPFFDTAEIIELHHDGKADAPAGTAIELARRLSSASAEWAADPTQHEIVPGARGADGGRGIRIHSVRMRGMVAHNELILGTLGQTLTIRQDSYDRASYVPGVLLACRRVADLPGVTVGLDEVL